MPSNLSMPRAARRLRTIIAGIVSLLSGLSHAQQPPEPNKDYHFNRMVAHWDAYGGPDYVEFIRDAKPQVAQVGFYGAHFWSLVHTPQFNGYPAHFPVRGLPECSDWFRALNARLHDADVKVVGHFNIEFLIGDPDSDQGPRGFFHWYHHLWDVDILGPKPVHDPMEFLEKQADGSPILETNYSIGGMKEYWACLRNPAWQEVLKAWVRRGIDLGLDGFMINYFYRHNCHCRHCDTAFRDYLRKRFPPEELRSRFQIDNVEIHDFDEIVSWHDPASTTPLRLEMLRFSQLSNKTVFDEVFLKYGRSLKPDLIVGQWNHLGDFGQINGDERCLLPAEVWAKGESYLWYSTGDAANFTDLKNGVPGDATLQARYIRGASNDKPYTLGKYESTRIRAAIAELAANGGAPMGFYTRFTDPDAREVIVEYYHFLRRYESLYHNNQSHAEIALAFPRSHVHKGDVAAVKRFRELGRVLLDEQVLFDVLPDDMLHGMAGRYRQVITVDMDASAAIAALLPERSRFEAPFTTRVAASRPAESSTREIDLHFVNYNREEPPPGADGRPSPGNGIQDEKPIPAEPVLVDMALPEDAAVRAIQFLTPEDPEPASLDWSGPAPGRIRFSTPGFHVYGVARVFLE